MKDYQEKIEQYLSGKMSATDQRSFEQEMTSQSALKEAVEQEMVARKVVQTAGRGHLKARLEKIDAAGPAAKHRMLGSSRRIWWLAASIIGLVIGLWWFSPSHPPSGPELFAQNFEAYRSPSLERGNPNEEPTNWQRGLSHYTEQEYGQAASAFEKSLAPPQAPTYLVQFYLGQCYLAQSPPQPEKALQAFEKVMQEDHFYRQATQWYQALTHLQLGHIETAQVQLQTLAEQGDFQPKEVARLLEALD